MTGFPASAHTEGWCAISVKPIRIFGDPVLRTSAEPVRDFDAELRKLVKDLTDTMMEAPGVGLPQSVIDKAINDARRTNDVMFAVPLPQAAEA